MRLGESVQTVRVSNASMKTSPTMDSPATSLKIPLHNLEGEVSPFIGFGTPKVQSPQTKKMRFKQLERYI